MPEGKRKTRTSIAAVDRYNKKTYDMVSVRLPKETVTAFKAKCAAEGIPQAQIIKKAIADFLGEGQTLPGEGEK